MANENKLPIIPQEISRGASETFLFSMTDPDGNLYYLQEGEVLRFGVKRDRHMSVFLLKKVLTPADLKDGVYAMTLKPAETAKLPAGNYEWDIGIQYGDDFRPIVAASPFTVNGTVTGWEALADG